VNRRVRYEDGDEEEVEEGEIPNILQPLRGGHRSPGHAAPDVSLVESGSAGAAGGTRSAKPPRRSRRNSSNTTVSYAEHDENSPAVSKKSIRNMPSAAKSIKKKPTPTKGSKAGLHQEAARKEQLAQYIAHQKRYFADLDNFALRVE
jgi:hypothetical protein